MSAPQAKLHVVKKEEAEVLRGTLLLPQAGQREEDGACRRTEGRTDSGRFKLNAPIGL